MRGAESGRALLGAANEVEQRRPKLEQRDAIGRREGGRARHWPRRRRRTKTEERGEAEI